MATHGPHLFLGKAEFDPDLGLQASLAGFQAGGLPKRLQLPLFL